MHQLSMNAIDLGAQNNPLAIVLGKFILGKGLGRPDV